MSRGYLWDVPGLGEGGRRGQHQGDVVHLGRVLSDPAAGRGVEARVVEARVVDVVKIHPDVEALVRLLLHHRDVIGRQ